LVWKPLSNESWRQFEYVRVVTAAGAVTTISVELLDDMISGNARIAELLGDRTYWAEIAAHSNSRRDAHTPNRLSKREIFDLYGRLLSLDKRLRETEKFAEETSSGWQQ